MANSSDRTFNDEPRRFKGKMMKEKRNDAKQEASASAQESGSILHLTLHKRWFDMIASGEKKEEYREMKPFWNTRLNKTYSAIKFVNGYGAPRPWIIVELKEHLTGLGIIEWGAPESKPVHILKLGTILESND